MRPRLNVHSCPAGPAESFETWFSRTASDVSCRDARATMFCAMLRLFCAGGLAGSSLTAYRRSENAGLFFRGDSRSAIDHVYGHRATFGWDFSVVHLHGHGLSGGNTSARYLELDEARVSPVADRRRSWIDFHRRRSRRGGRRSRAAWRNHTATISRHRQTRPESEFPPSRDAHFEESSISWRNRARSSRRFGSARCGFRPVVGIGKQRGGRGDHPNQGCLSSWPWRQQRGSQLLALRAASPAAARSCASARSKPIATEVGNALQYRIGHCARLREQDRRSAENRAAQQ